jgi:hypothetical protein
VSNAQIKVFYENLERQRFNVSAIGKEVCSTTKEGVIKVRLGGDDAMLDLRK